MSVGIHQLKSNMAAMDQTREAANWLTIYADGDDNDERFYIDGTVLKEAVRKAREDIKDEHIPKPFNEFLSTKFTIKDLEETTDHLERQLADLIRKEGVGGGIELEVCW